MSAITATVIGAAATATGTYMSFKEVSRQGKAAAAARIEAEKATQEAKKRAEQNVYEALSLIKDPYERAREAALVVGAQAIGAGSESERGGAATAGRVVMGQNVQQGQIADVQAQEMQGLNQMVAAEESRLKDYAAYISLAEAEGAQQAIKDAEKLRAANTIQGVQGIANTASTVGEAINLYKKSSGSKSYDKLIKQGSKAGLSQEQIQNQVASMALTDPKFASLSGVGYSAKSVDANGNPIVNAMTPLQFQDFMIQNPGVIKQLIKKDIFAKANIPIGPTVVYPSSITPQAQGVGVPATEYEASGIGELSPYLTRKYGIDPFSIQ